MGTANGADELGLCPHGLACPAGAWGRYIGFCPGYGHIWTKFKSDPAGKKYSARPITLCMMKFLQSDFGVLSVRRCRCGSRYRASESGNARSSYCHKPAGSIIFDLPLVRYGCVYSSTHEDTKFSTRMLDRKSTKLGRAHALYLLST